MPLHILLVATGAPGQPNTRTSCPQRPTPGLSAPERNAGSQVPLRPRELRVIATSLPASRVAAACRLRQSCHRDRGPVALPRSGCPVHRSHHPAAVAQSLLPATPRGILRSRSAATPRPTPAKRRAILRQQQPTNPLTPRLLDPAYALRINQQGVRSAHVRLLSPCVDGPPGAGRVAFRCGARLARVVRLQKEGWGDPHTPFVAREACRRRNRP